MTPPTHLAYRNLDGSWRTGCRAYGTLARQTSNLDSVTCKTCRRSNRFAYWASLTKRPDHKERP